MSDDALIGAARDGDRSAIEELLRRYQERVFRFGMKMCGDADDAKDVMQETLLAASRSVGNFRGASSVPTWLYTIARSFCMKKRRRSKFAPVEGSPLERPGADVVSAVPGPEATAAGREIQRALAAALGDLEPAAREVLILRDVEGLTAAEVAEVTGDSVEAVKSRLHRARTALRLRLRPLLDPEGAAPPPKPSCPDILALYSRNLEGDIDAKVCARMERHVAGCASCRGSCESLKRTLAVCRGSTGSVPETVQAAVRVALRAALDSPPP